MAAIDTLDEIDRHVSAIFDVNVPATHCIRLVCQDCARLSILPVPGPGVDEDRPWLCPVCTAPSTGPTGSPAPRASDHRPEAGRTVAAQQRVAAARQAIPAEVAR
jgi:hypothetical protein